MIKALFKRMKGVFGWFRNHRTLSLHLLMLVCLLFQGLVGFTVYSSVQTIEQQWHTDYKEFVGNLIIAMVAHKMAGEEIPFKPDYTYDDTFWVWGEFETNSYWVADYTFKILPMLVYEQATAYPGNYPDGVGFSPYIGTRSLRVAGTAIPAYLFVYLNDRYVTDGLWDSEAAALTTLIHELIHIQGGAYFKGDVEDFEAHTSAATVEILAAMCNQGDPIACQGFWNEIEHMTRACLYTWFSEHGWDAQYQTLADLLFRNSIEEIVAKKSVRYWSGHKLEQRAVMKAYQIRPWYEMVISGVLNSRYRLNTQLVDYSQNMMIVGMPFDDTAFLLSDLVQFLKWLPVDPGILNELH